MADDDPSNKVVVAEDDPAVIELLSDELRMQGFEPLVIRRGSTVVKTVKDEKPGAVVLDLALPDKDGTQILKELKDDWDAKKVPVIVISAYTGRLDHTGRRQRRGDVPQALRHRSADGQRARSRSSGRRTDRAPGHRSHHARRSGPGGHARCACSSPTRSRSSGGACDWPSKKPGASR